MIKSVLKAMSILEYLSKDMQREIAPSEIARALGMDRATCANIIKTLSTKGYVQQSTPRGGYKLGYALFQMTTGEVANEELTKIARDEVEHLSRILNESVLLSVIRNDKRVSLCSAVPDRNLYVRPSEDKSVYAANTGRVILANYTPEHLERFIIRHGLPAREEWSQLYESDDVESALRNACAEIKMKGYAIQVEKDLIGFAAPLFRDGHVVGSVGTYLPAYRMTDQQWIIREILAAAGRINRKIALSWNN